MPVNLPPPDPEALFPIEGMRLGVAQAGIRKQGRKDLLLVELAPTATVAGVFTLNRYCAAPVIVCREHLAQGHDIRAILVNTGCANAGTGQRGLDAANETCRAVAQRLGCDPRQVLPFSTGVILEHLPTDRVIAGLAQAQASLSSHAWADAATAIMTTDTVPKANSKRLKIGDEEVTITGISKGAGMIKPNMATMLGFVATDATIAPDVLQRWVQEAADQSFNRVTVDGDTSTNDSFLLIATGARSVSVTAENESDHVSLKDAIFDVSRTLAQAIVRDGEGATKFITITVESARHEAEALQIAYSIAHSPLIKTAFFASDPNLGRILAAIGYANVSDLDVSRLKLYLGDILVAEDGGRAATYTEQMGQQVMKQSEILVRVQLNRGEASTTVWTCDLSHDYVSINADYRS